MALVIKAPRGHFMVWRYQAPRLDNAPPSGSLGKGEAA